jgi:hypothetical protein
MFGTAPISGLSHLRIVEPELLPHFISDKVPHASKLPTHPSAVDCAKHGNPSIR